jgi:hypothetical protein
VGKLREQLAKAEVEREAARAVAAAEIAAAQKSAAAEVKAARDTAGAEVAAKDQVIAELRTMLGATRAELTEARRPWWRLRSR